MVDTHTSNGADYQYTMTLINTQTDKLGGELGSFCVTLCCPKFTAPWTNVTGPTCPYVNPVRATPDGGIEGASWRCPGFPRVTRHCTTA